MELSLPHPVVRGLLRGTAGLPARTRMPVGLARRWFDLVGGVVRPPANTSVEEGELGGVPTYTATSGDADPLRTIVYFHGGGYVNFARPSFLAFIRAISLATRSVVHMPDYPLAPERPYPAATDAGLAAYRALAARANRPIVLAGDSAGGNLAVVTAVALRDAGDDPPAGMVLFSPWLDLSHSGPSFRDNGSREPILTKRDSVGKAMAYAAGADLGDPRLSPLFTESLAGLPPTFMVGGADDILVSDADRYAQRVREAGGEMDYRRHEGVWHDFQLFGDMLAEARGALAEAFAAIDGFFARSSVATGGPVEAAAQG
jgi:epsilon-lactone hydrolase